METTLQLAADLAQFSDHALTIGTRLHDQILPDNGRELDVEAVKVTVDPLGEVHRSARQTDSAAEWNVEGSRRVDGTIGPQSSSYAFGSGTWTYRVLQRELLRNPDPDGDIHLSHSTGFTYYAGSGDDDMEAAIMPCVRKIDEAAAKTLPPWTRAVNDAASSTSRPSERPSCHG